MRILCVDDQPITLMVLKLELKKEFNTCNVVTASSAEEAIKFLTNEKYDLVISDFSMNGMNGIDFLNEVHKKWSETKTILLTGYFVKDEELRLSSKNKLIKKPWLIEDLTSSIRELM